MLATTRSRPLAWIALGVVLTLALTLIVTQTWRAGAADGDSSTFVPTDGCRAFDYRPAPNQVGPRPTPLGEGETHTQQITGGAGNCTDALAIPSTATAIAMNVTAVGATAQTNLRLFSADLSNVPLLSSLNVSAGQPPVPNQVDVQLSAGGAIKIFNFKGNVSVIGDIVGYYTNEDIADLANRLPAVFEAFDSDAEPLGAAPAEVLSLEVPVRAAGKALVEYTVSGQLDDSGGAVACAVYPDGAIPPAFGSPPPGSSVTGAPGTTRAFTLHASTTFDVTPGTVKYQLACARVSATATVVARNLVITIIPGAPI
ncbi:MAG: hypothetical protein AAFY28_13545, partial [Actinomycetota bacterium]